MSSKYIDIGRGVNFTNDTNTYGTNSKIYMNLSNTGVFNIYNPLANTSLVNIYGGLSINHASDISSLTQGGALTIAGGSVVLGNTFFGRNLYLGNNLNTSGLVTINTQTSGNMFTGTWTNTAGNIKAFNITTPSSGNDTGLDSVVFDNPNAFALIIDPTANILNSGSRLFIDGTWGNVNIGTSTPVNSNAPLYLFGTGNEVNFQIRINNSQSALRLAVPKTNVVVANAVTTASIFTNDFGAIQFGSGVNGTSANRIYFSTRGNIGINNTNPNFILDVTGTGNVSTSITTASVSVINNTTTNMVSTSTTTSNCNSVNSTVSNLFNTTGSITINNLNVSTSITTSNLNFTGNIYKYGVLYTGSESWLPNPSNSIYYSGGNVGINTTAPNFSLDIQGTSGMRIQTNATLNSVFITTTGNISFITNINSYGNMVNNTGNSLAFTSNIKTLNNRLRTSRANATSCVSAWYLRVSTTGASFNFAGP